MAASWPPEGWFESLGAPEPHQMRDAMVQVALRAVGLGPADRAYRQLCYPHDSDKDARRMAVAQSACALVCAGLLRCIGFEHPYLDEPYARQYLTLDAMSRLRWLGGWHRDVTAIPEPGEIAIIGEGLRTHALTCVDRDDATLLSVDGGTGAIRLVRRTIVVQGGKVGLRDVTSGTRWMLGVLRVGELMATRAACLPPARG